MSRYVEQLIAHIPPDRVAWMVLTNRPDALSPATYHAPLVRGPAVRPTALWLHMIVPGLLSALPAGLAHFTTGRAPRSCPLPYVLTVHDLTPLDHPEWYPWRERLLVAGWLGGSIRQAAAIIAVSESTRAAIARRFPGMTDRVRVIHEAAAPIFHQPVDPAEIRAVRARYGLGPRSWLHLGSLTPRKNVPRLVEAFARVVRAGSGIDHEGSDPPQLVLVGGYDADAVRVAARVAALARSLGLDRLVRRLGQVPEGDLPALYAASELLIAPSLHEGFGLTAIEAMAVGVPVLASRAGGLAEVVGDAAWIVDPQSVDAIASGLAQLAGDPDLRMELAGRGRAQAARFSWERAAAETVAVYRAARRP